MFLPSLLQRTQTRPLLGLRVKTLHRIKQLSIGAAADGVDLFVHGGVATNLQDKRSQSHHMQRWGWTRLHAAWSFRPPVSSAFGALTLRTMVMLV